jgi:hypothetical protein
MGYSEYDPAAKERRPWNVGRMVGSKRALKPQQVADNYATNIRRCRHGWRDIPASRCISRRPLRPGSISSSASDLTDDVIRAGSFASVNQLIRDVKNYLAQRNADPKPYVWRAEGAAILAKIKRARAALYKAEAA